MNKTKSLKHLCKCYLINKDEIKKMNSSVHSQEDVLYFVKLAALTDSIEYVEKELNKIKVLCGKRAYSYFVDRYIYKITLDDVLNKLSTSKSSLYREIKNWEEIYEQSK